MNVGKRLPQGPVAGTGRLVVKLESREPELSVHLGSEES